MALSTDQPGKLDFRWYPRNAHTRTLTWSDIDLTDRTFELRRPGEDDIDVDVTDDATMTFTVPAITKNSLRQAWSLVETTDDEETTWMGGTIFWELSYDEVEDDNAVTITIGNGIPITVVGSGAVALAAEAAARAAGDATNAAAIAAETARATAAEATKETPAGAQSKANAAQSAAIAAAAALVDDGSGVTDAAAWRTAIGAQQAGTYLVPGDIGSTVQAYDADLAAVASAGAVLLSGPQTVAGVKTFSSAPVVPAAAFPEAAVSGLVADLAAKVPASAFTQAGDFLLGTGAGTYQVVSLLTLDGGTASSIFAGSIDGGTA